LEDLKEEVKTGEIYLKVREQLALAAFSETISPNMNHIDPVSIIIKMLKESHIMIRSAILFKTMIKIEKIQNEMINISRIHTTAI
jgi:hypothetical protein